MASLSPAPRPARPVLDSSMRGRSYLEELQQYRQAHQDGHQGIDSIVQGISRASSSSSPPPKSFSAYSGVPSSKSPPKIVESGVTHTLSHANCQPESGSKSNRLIATLFYRAKSPRISNSFRLPDRTASPAAFSNLPLNLAPLSDAAAFPLEPPPPNDPMPLDHLYGSHISPLCLTSFLALINSLPLPSGTTTITSSHRCLTNPPHPRVVELTFSPAPDPKYVTLEDLRHHELLYRFEQEWNVDVVIQEDTIWRRHPRLVVFDMDSTLIKEEVIDLIAASIGPEFEAKVSAITARAMAGELDFAESLRERAALLRGVPDTVLTALRSVITPTPGAKELIRGLKRLGVKTAVLSGGFIPLTSWLASQLGIDYAYANTLTVEDGKLTGEVQGEIVGAEKKASLLLEIAKKEGIDVSQTVVVGDGANDLKMMAEAGLGVAWNAKARVQMEAQSRLNGDSLLDLLFFFGFTEEEVRMLTVSQSQQ